MSFFPPNPGELETNVYYSDNEPYCQDIRFSVPYEQWSEFENSQLFRDITTYVESVRIPDKECTNHVQECTQETEALMQSSSLQDCRVSFWARARNAFRRK